MARVEPSAPHPPSPPPRRRVIELESADERERGQRGPMRHDVLELLARLPRGDRTVQVGALIGGSSPPALAIHVTRGRRSEARIVVPVGAELDVLERAIAAVRAHGEAA